MREKTRSDNQVRSRSARVRLISLTLEWSLVHERVGPFRTYPRRGERWNSITGCGTCRAASEAESPEPGAHQGREAKMNDENSCGPDEPTSADASGRKPYVPPVLRVYGDVAELTRIVATSGNLDGQSGNHKKTA